MSENKVPVEYSMSVIATNIAAMNETMLEQQRINASNAVLLKQIDDSLKSIRKSLEAINKRRIVVQK